jgi:hypothetical protein
MPLSKMSALSLHKKETISHKNMPIVDKIRSHNSNESTPLMDIAVRTNAEATHLTYQSVVYLGVADLYIRLLFSISSCVNFGSATYDSYT